MAKYESLRGLFTAIADAIRAKTGSTGAIVAEDFPEFIEGIEPVIEPLTITENGTYTAPDGIDGYSPVTVDVKGSGGAKVASGTFTVAETVTLPVLKSSTTPSGGYRIEHGLGVLPKYFAIAPDIRAGINIGAYGLFSIVMRQYEGDANYVYIATVLAGSTPMSELQCVKNATRLNATYFRTTEYIDIYAPYSYNDQEGCIKEGIKYTWFAIAEG